MKHLQPFKAAPPVEKEVCAACETFTPELLVPVGDAAVPMCWLCAHHVVEHGTAPHHAHAAECECTPQEIYPDRVFNIPSESAPEIQIHAQLSPLERERKRLLELPPEQLAVWAREAHKQMSPTQRAAVKRKAS